MTSTACPNGCRCCTPNPPLSVIVNLPHHPNAPILTPDPEEQLP